MAMELVGWWGADVDIRIPMKYYLFHEVSYYFKG
jgi:hypothetical protein